MRRYRGNCRFHLLSELLKARGKQGSKDFGVVLPLLSFEPRQGLAKLSDGFLVSLPKRRCRICIAELLKLPPHFRAILDRLPMLAQAPSSRREYRPSNRGTGTTVVVPAAEDPNVTFFTVIEHQPKRITKRHQRPLHGIGLSFLDSALMGLAEIETQSMT